MNAETITTGSVALIVAPVYLTLLAGILLYRLKIVEQNHLAPLMGVAVNFFLPCFMIQ
jgi:predicted permease